MANFSDAERTYMEIVEFDGGKAKQISLNGFSFPQIPAVKLGMIQSSMGPFQTLEKIALDRNDDINTSYLYGLYANGAVLSELKITFGFTLADRIKPYGRYEPRQVFTFSQVTIENIMSGNNRAETFQFITCKFADFTVVKEAFSSVWQTGGPELIRLKK